MDWQPIETAPTDTEILGFYDDDMAVVTWVENPPYPGWWSLTVTGAWAADSEWWPTHWMPLPEPPKVQQ